MATNKTTVSVYADDDLLAALNSFKDSGNHKSLNVAIVAILREKLFGETSQGKVSGNLQNTLDIDSKIDEAIAAKLSEIKDEIKEEYGAGFRGISANITDLLQQRDREIDGLKTAIAPLLARLEALETNRSEATAPANFTPALLESESSSASDVAESSVEPDALPIIEEIATIADSTIESQSRQNLTELSENEKNNVLDNVLTQIILDENKPKTKAPDETLTGAIANTAIDDSTASIELPVKEVVAITKVETLNDETGMNTNEAFAIAQQRGYKGNSKSFRDRFNKQDMAKDFGLRRIPHDGGREKWLYFDTKS